MKKDQAECPWIRSGIEEGPGYEPGIWSGKRPVCRRQAKVMGAEDGSPQRKGPRLRARGLGSVYMFSKRTRPTHGE